MKYLAVVAVLAAAAAALAAGAWSRSTSSVPPLDEQYLKTSAQGDAFEIQGGAIAQKHAKSKQVKALGARLHKDHSKSLSDLKKVASKLGVSVESKPTPPEAWELKVVASMSGKKFDQWYSDLEVQDHMQDISETVEEIQDGQSADVKKLAQEDLPMLRTHLKLSKAALTTASK